MSLAAKSRLPGGGGWLSMAPTIDDEPIASSSTSTYSATYQQQQQQQQQAGTNSNSSSRRGSNDGYLYARPKPAESSYPSRLLPRTNARFKVGDSSQLATPASPAPSSPRSNDASAQDSPPPFDVRASFAPMPRYGSKQPAQPSSSSATATTGTKKDVEGGNGANVWTSQPVSTARQPQGQKSVTIVEEKEDARAKNKSNDGEGISASEEDDEDDGQGIHYAGIQWKGKTAHAVEQEMEALGDRTVMSYAPDAVYLASRLEGLKRNLEVGGERMKRWAWEDYEDKSDDADDEREDEAQQAIGSDGEDNDDDNKTSTQAATPKSPMMVLTPDDADADKDRVIFDPTTDQPSEQVVEADSLVSPSLPAVTVTEQPIDADAKAAALDSRVEIRTLRRPDLEQVRELHCYHGNGDKVDTESYTTSAGFLLRLLVDEHHVCLVAVAKPLPEPGHMPTAFVPGCPPPSLDMPPARSPFLVAAAGPTMLDHHLHGGNGSSGPRAMLLPYGGAATSHQHVPEATAPRSFGAGPNSSSSNSIDDEAVMSEDEDDDLFESRRPANLHLKGTKSPREAFGKRMLVLQGEDCGDVEPTTDTEMTSPPRESELQAMQESASKSKSSKSPVMHADRLRRPSGGRSSNSAAFFKSVLAGPTHDVAPPRAVRVMAAPPPNGLPRDTETILGVASARIKVVARAHDDDIFSASGKAGAWPGIESSNHEQSKVTREAHIITLSVNPMERGQGLGARLLDHLLEECKRRTAGPRKVTAEGTAEEGRRQHDDAPMRTFLEVHPSNSAALGLYETRGFKKIQGRKGVIKGFYRGDARIPASVRLQVGGADAIRLERLDRP